MRRFTDAEGRTWDVVIGRESFGALLALFVPAAGNPGAARQTALAAKSHMEAETELDAMSVGALNRLLRRSEPKEQDETLHG